MLAGSVQATRMLSIEPGTPVTLGAEGADGCSWRSIISTVTDMEATLFSFFCPSFTVTLTEYLSFVSWSYFTPDLVRI